MLTGEAKKNYQRDYMRKRRAALDVRPTLKALVKLDLTLDKCTKGLQNTNDNLEEVIKIMTDDPNEVLEGSQTMSTDDLKGNTTFVPPETGQVVVEILPAEEPKATCSACNGRGYIELDRIGLVTGPCPDCRFPKKP